MRLCTRDRSVVWTLVGLGSVYYVLLGVALANPVRAPPHAQDIAILAASLACNVALLVLVYRRNRGCGKAGRTRVSWVLAALLAASLAARLPLLISSTDQARYGRWDSAAATLAEYAFATQLYFALVPAKKVWKLGYIWVPLVALPLVAAVPNALRELRSPPVDRDLVLRAAQAAQSSYARWTFGNQATDTHALVEVHGRDLYLAFPGTASKKDFRTDLRASDKELPSALTAGRPTGAKVHRGFLEAYLSVRHSVLGVVKAGGAERVVCCGHSLGGALATLASLDLAGQGVRVACVTFGSPQVGDAAFVRSFDSRVPVSVRVVNPYDFVPRSLRSQLEHVKGYHFVAGFSFAPDVFTTHSMAAYARAVRRSRWVNWVALLVVQPAYTLAAVLLVLLVAKGVGLAFKKF